MKKPLFFSFFLHLLNLSISLGADDGCMPDVRKRRIDMLQQEQNIHYQQYLDHLDRHPTLDDLLDKVEAYILPPIWRVICFSANCFGQCIKGQLRYMEREAAELAEILPSYNDHKISINPLFQP